MRMAFFAKDIYFNDKQQFYFQEKVQALSLSDFMYLFCGVIIH